MIIASAQQYTVATILSSMMYFKGELSDDEHGMSFDPLPLPSLHPVFILFLYRSLLLSPPSFTTTSYIALKSAEKCK